MNKVPPWAVVMKSAVRPPAAPLERVLHVSEELALRSAVGSMEQATDY